MTAGPSMPTGKTAAEVKAGMRSDRTVCAERRNRLEKVRNDFQMKLLDRKKARARFVIGKERKDIAKSFQSVQQTTGQSELGIPSSFHDKDVCSSEHYRCGVVISNRRLKQWRRQEEYLQKHVTKEEVNDEEELSDRQIVLNNLLAEIRHEYDNFNEITQQRSRPVKELRMPYAAKATSLDVFENLRTEDERRELGRPATAPVQRIIHRNGTALTEPEPVVTKKSKSYFNFYQWEKLITRQYIDRENDSILVMSNGYPRPHSAHVPILAMSKTCIEPKISNGRLETPLFIRVNKNLSEEHGVLKIRPHSASLTDESRKNKHDTSRPKSSPMKRKSALKSNSTNTMESGHLNPENPNEPTPQTAQISPSKNSVAFDLKPTVHDFKSDHTQIANGGDVDDPDVTSGRHRKSGIAMVPDTSVLGELHGGEDVDETSEAIIDISRKTQIEEEEETRPDDMVTAEITEASSPNPLNKPPGTPESSSTSSRKTSSAIRKVSFQDSYRPIQRMPRGFQQDRDRKISSSSTGSSSSRRESIDILRKKHLVINLDVRGSLNKRLTNANQTEGREGLGAGDDEEARPSGPPQWRRELLRDAPPGLYSAAEKPKVHLTMSKSARKKELEKMVESNTSNLRDIIISEKERRAQSRMNMQKSMAELDSIQK